MKTTAILTQPKRLVGSRRGVGAALTCIGAATLLLGSNSALGGSATWDFTTDPTTGATPIEVYQTGFADSTGASQYWKAAGGNPGGFLGVTWPIGGSSSIIIFPDIDQGKLVTAFRLEADLRVGNPQQDARAADGFSLNFARSDDTVFQNHSSSDFATSGAVETGTKTGIAILFDTWSGNALPDGADIEGIIVRIDNKTVLRQAMPTRNGACNDDTSLQTGPRNLPYWTEVKADPSWPDGAFVEGSWTNLCWTKLIVELDSQSQLTVVWKGRTILDKVKTSFFPSAGGIVLAGRTGGADQHTHFDNLTLTTTAIAADTTPPTAPTALATVGDVGSTRVALTWGASTDNSGRVAYELSRNGTVLASTVTDTTYLDYPPKGGATYTYSVRAKDVSNNFSPAATLAVTTPADAAPVGTVRTEIWTGIGGTGVGDLQNDTRFPDSPTIADYAFGLTVGSPNGNAGWNESFGDNFGLRVTGTLTPTVSGNYHFFIRSDDASAFWLNTSGSAIPDINTAQVLIEETGCCNSFYEPDAGDASTTATPVALTAGTAYGFVVLLKEGGGGDGAGVAWRIEGDTTPAANLQPISGFYIKGAADAVGATLDFVTQPADVSTFANEKATFSVAVAANSNYGTNVWYQWLKNGAPISGAASSSYTIPVLAVADNGAQISVVVGTYGLTKTSSVATLTVAADTKKPAIASVSQADDSFTSVVVNFSEPVTSPTATTAGNYTLSGGATVSAAALSADRFSVTLTTSKLTEDTEYTLTVNNVADNAGNAITAATQVKFTAWTLVAKRTKLEIWTGISGTAVDALLTDARFPNSPDRVIFRNGGLQWGEETNFGDTYGDNHGARQIGYLVPTSSGQYRFFIRSDDASSLYINTTGNTFPDPTTATAVAIELGCCGPFEEVGAGGNGDGTFPTSEPISLTAGQRYPIVYLVKEGGGGDWGQVAWRKEGDTTPANTLPAIQNEIFYYGPKAAPAAPTIKSITATGGNVVITWDGTATLQSATAVTGPYSDVTGATSPYSTPATGAGTYFRLRQ